MSFAYAGCYTPNGGGKPVHLSLHPAGRYLFVANYDGGTIAVLPIGADGSLEPASDIKTDRGCVGPAKPTNAPPGSFADSGHDGPHAHYVESDPSGRFVLHTDLGQDRIYVWRFEAGTLTPIETVSTLPAGFAGTSYGSDLKLSADGRFAYAANRLHDSIATFAIEDGLRLVDHTPTWGSYPRTLVIQAGFLYAMNQRSDAITVFRLQDGIPHFTGRYIPTGSPAHLAFSAR